jgi:hypothetical protein
MFHCGYCGRDGHKGEFFFKKRREEKMPKEQPISWCA